MHFPLLWQSPAVLLQWPAHPELTPGVTLALSSKSKFTPFMLNARIHPRKPLCLVAVPPERWERKLWKMSNQKYFSAADAWKGKKIAFVLTEENPQLLLCSVLFKSLLYQQTAGFQAEGEGVHQMGFLWSAGAAGRPAGKPLSHCARLEPNATACHSVAQEIWLSGLLARRPH